MAVLVTFKWGEPGQEEKIVDARGLCSAWKVHLQWQEARLLETLTAGKAGLVQQLHFLGKK